MKGLDLHVSSARVSPSDCGTHGTPHSGTVILVPSVVVPPELVMADTARHNTLPCNQSVHNKRRFSLCMSTMIPQRSQKVTRISSSKASMDAQCNRAQKRVLCLCYRRKGSSQDQDSYTKLSTNAYVHTVLTCPVAPELVFADGVTHEPSHQKPSIVVHAPRAMVSLHLHH